MKAPGCTAAGTRGRSMHRGGARAILYAGQTYDVAMVWVAVFVLCALAMAMYFTVLHYRASGLVQSITPAEWLWIPGSWPSAAGLAPE